VTIQPQNHHEPTSKNQLAIKQQSQKPPTAEASLLITTGSHYNITNFQIVSSFHSCTIKAIGIIFSHLLETAYTTVTYLTKPTLTTTKSPSPLQVLGSSPVSPYSSLKMTKNL
jgi:hypothetical protein